MMGDENTHILVDRAAELLLRATGVAKGGANDWDLQSAKSTEDGDE